LLGYLAILGSLLAPEGERSRFATVAFTLGGLGFSAYLTYRELFSIHHICEWCVSSAIIITILSALATVRFLRADDRDAPPTGTIAVAPTDAPDAPEAGARVGTAHR
jgi:uncharacterized membrane protein